MTKLLHVSANVFPDLKTEHSTKKIWKELSKGFDEYHIIARAQDNKFHTYYEGNITLHLVPNLKKASSFSITSFWLIKIIVQNKIDVIISQCPILGGFTSNIVAKFFGIPVFQEVHDTYYFDLFKSKNLRDIMLSRITKYSIKKATTVRALNAMMADMILNIVPNANIAVVENRVNTNRFVAKESMILHKPIRITSIGTFVKRKGYHTAIDALKLVNERFQCELVLIGGGLEKDNLIKQADGSNSIIIYDRLSQDELADILKGTDIYIQPSLREGMPRTILEAMAMKLPIIATNVSTIPGTITNYYNGLLVEPDNPKELGNAIMKLIEDETLRNKIAENAYKDAIEKFEWGLAFKNYRTEILKTININSVNKG